MVRRIQSRGAALIVVLGVLLILALLATTFATLQATERNVARNYLDTVRARLIAESGVDHAVNSLQQLISTSLVLDPSTPLGRSWVYYGDQLNEANLPNINTLLHQAQNPSFAMEDEAKQDPSDPNTLPKQIRVEGASVGYSGVVGGTYSTNGDQYTLRVRDLSGLIYVNDGVGLYGGNAHSVSQNLRRILNRLGDVIGAAGVGDTIILKRPSFGYRSPQNLEDVLGSTLYRQIAPYVTVVAWVDPNVAQPVPFSASTSASYPVTYFRGSPAVYRRGRGKNYVNTQDTREAVLYESGMPNRDNAIYALDELFPQWIEIVSRAPVNINSAPREVLIALLADLQGFFISHRKRNNLSPVIGGYFITTLEHTFSWEAGPAHTGDIDYKRPESEGDEYGFLTKTAPFTGGSGSAVAGSTSAAAVADAIIACREKRGVYSGLPFGGTFRTWRQFNAFCDHLVSSGVIQDNRPLYWQYQMDDFAPGSTSSGDSIAGGSSATGFSGTLKAGNITGFNPLQASAEEAQKGSQALADVLKANFNPNLHLNETNPDANLYTMVDKTDLIVNSTEFILSPTGYYEIGSVSRVLRAKDGYDALAASDNQIVATHTIVAAVQLFDLYRETAQSQFSKGTLNPTSATRPGTSSGKSVEIGPEPDNGIAPQENDWGGYIALPTVGGLQSTKAPGQLVPTPSEASDFSETIGVHFQRDFKPYHHVDGETRRHELGSTSIPGESASNFADPDEGTVGGPYAPTMGAPGRYRLARSFRMPAPGGPSMSLPTITEQAPLDLRIDGGYSERHSAPAYWVSPQSLCLTTKDMLFTVSFWIKPSYPPARAGKPHLMVDLNRFNGIETVLSKVNNGMQNWLHLMYNAGHEIDAPGGVSNGEEFTKYAELLWGKPATQKPMGHAPFRPYSFMFGRGYGNRTVLPLQPQVSTDAQQSNPHMPRMTVYTGVTVNHEGHGDGKKTVFKENRWTHVTMVCFPRATIEKEMLCKWEDMSAHDYNKIFVNGVALPNNDIYDSREGYQNFQDDIKQNIVQGFQPGDGKANLDAELDWTRHYNPSTGQNNGDVNPLRLGTVSQIIGGNVAGGKPYVERANFAADATFDELYVWGNQDRETTARDLWTAGRYQKPGGTGGSPDTAEGVFKSREINLALSQRTFAPPSSVVPPGGPGALPPSMAATGVETEILGVAWTAYGEDPSDPVMYVSNGTSTTRHDVRTSMYLKSGATTTPALLDDGFSSIQNQPIRLGATDTFQYMVRMEVTGNPIMLATPVIDDVTVFYRSSEGAKFVYYISVLTTGYPL